MPAKNKQSVIKLQKLDLLMYNADAAKILTQSTNLIDVPLKFEGQPPYKL